MLWEIISMSAGSFVWGIFLSLLCMATFVFIITSWWRDAMFTVWSYLVGAALFLLLAFQCTMIVGSLKILDTVDVYENYITEVVNQVYDDYEEVSPEDTDVFMKKLITEYPLVRHYLNWARFEGYNARTLPAAMADEMRSYMWKYIFRRLMWCLGGVLVAGALGIWSLDRHNDAMRPSRNYSHNSSRRDTGRQRPTSSGMGRRPHISTRRR